MSLGIGEVRAETERIEFFHATTQALTVGAVVGVEARAADPVDALLDADRVAWQGRRGEAIWAAATVAEAMVIASIHAAPRRTAAVQPDSALRVYRVRLIPFHRGPIAVLAALQAQSRPCVREQLVEQYWKATTPWWLQELLTPSMRVLEHVPPAGERELYLPRWVHYQQDLERARAIGESPPQ